MKIRNCSGGPLPPILGEKHSLPGLGGGGTQALWSTSGLLIKLLTWEPLAILGGRSIVAGIVIWLSLRRGDPISPTSPAGKWWAR
ncbi:hypothetical protein [Candidatus Amarolinea dominans]|uniref:hypothetical protein n=1 Tax=Candidatus Amarolinea dominans TaxID=3140696 RepID=UPI001DA105BC|nr:hypothetical protein [Anaerolineae bacterium]